MGSYTVVADAEYRREGWTLVGTGVSDLVDAWDNDDDGKYASCPSYKGRAAVRFPIDISSANIPDGAAITSVTVMIRVRKTVSDSKSVTVNVLSTEDTSRYTSRTLYPTTSFADYEVGTYTTDPLGNAWNKDRLNRLAIQVFSYSVPPNDGVRVAKLYAVINYKSRPTVRVTAPTGTVNSPSPTITWTYEQEDGDLQKSAEYKVFTATQTGGAEFNPDTTTATYSGTVTGDITTLTLPTLEADVEQGQDSGVETSFELEVRADGLVRIPGQSNLAGSSLTLDRAVLGVTTHCGVPFADAWALASTAPARFLGLPPLPPVTVEVTPSPAVPQGGGNHTLTADRIFLELVVKVEGAGAPRTVSLPQGVGVRARVRARGCRRSRRPARSAGPPRSAPGRPGPCRAARRGRARRPA